MAFNAGQILASLNLDRTPFQRNLRAAEADAAKVNGKTYTAKIDADIAAIQTRIQQVTAKLNDLQSQKRTPKIDADISAAQARIAQLNVQLRALQDKKIQIDADTRPAVSALQSAGQQFDWYGELLGARFMDKLIKKFNKSRPMLVVALGGILTAAAPAALLAASTLFGGIAAIALKENVVVQKAFDAMLKNINTALAQDTKVLVSTVTTAMKLLGGEFTRIRPMLQDTFVNLIPQIKLLTEGIIAFSQNAMPGLTRAVASADPVFAGLRDMLGFVGQGLTDFFDAIIGHAPAAGTVLSSLGRLIQELLGFVGQMSGTFAEFASGALPTFTTILGHALDILGQLLEFIEPIAPALGVMAGAVGAAALSWRLFQGVNNVLTGLGGRIAQVSLGAGLMAERMGASANTAQSMAVAGDRVGTALSKVGSALPVIGLAVMGVVMAWDALGTKSDEVSQKVLAGSMTLQDAINTERSQIEKRNVVASLYQDESTAMAAGMAELVNKGQAQNAALSAEEEARRNVNLAISAQLAQMGPLEQRQAQVVLAQERYNMAVEQFGPSSQQARDAQAALATAVDAAAFAQERAKLATESHTDALVRQQEEMAAVINADIAHEQSIQRVAEAQDRAKQAVTEHGAGSREASAAFLQERQAHVDVAEAAARKAQEEATARGETNAAEQASRAYITALIQQASTATGPVRSALLGYIANLTQTSGQAYDTELAAAGLTAEIKRIPPEVRVPVSAPGLDQTRAALGGLQQQMREINGQTITFYVNAQGDVGGIASAGRLAKGGIWQPAAAMASGGILGQNVERFAKGGVAHRLKPLRGGLATIVDPNTWRVIGDRMVGRESYIPHDQSARSEGILNRTAHEFGYGLMPLEAMRSLARFQEAVGFAAGGIADTTARMGTQSRWMTALRTGGGRSQAAQVDWRAMATFIADAIEKGLASRTVEHVTVSVPVGASVDEVVETAMFRVRHVNRGVQHRTR